MQFMDEQILESPLLIIAEPVSGAAYLSSTIHTRIVNTKPVNASPNGNKLFSSDLGIVLRLLLIFFIGVISIWANNEASRGFHISVTNDMKNTPVGDKFYMFYMSNDEAIRLVQGATTFAAKILYSNAEGITEKLIDQVNVQLTSQNLTHDHIVVTETVGRKFRYTLLMSSQIMKFEDFKYRMRKEFQRGMAEVLLFNIRYREALLSGMVECISNLAGFHDPRPVLNFRDFSDKCWEGKDPRIVAQCLGYCERMSKGFIARLNQVMSVDDCDAEIVEKALGMTATPLCESFHNSMVGNQGLVDLAAISTYK